MKNKAGKSWKRSHIYLAVVFLFAQPVVLASSAQAGAELRIWGLGEGRGSASPLLGVLIKLELDYMRLHPEVTFTHHLNGNDSALGGLYVGAADLIFMDREPTYIELDGYQQALAGQKPFTMPLMRGGVRSPAHSSPLVLVVNEMNPISTLKLSDLNALFNARVVARQTRSSTWAGLGLDASWSVRPVNLYGFASESAEGGTFSKTVMSGSRQWVCRYHEFSEMPNAFAAAKHVVEAVYRDADGLGLTTLDAVTAGVRVIAVGETAETAVLPSSQTLSSGEYVLGRTLSVLARADKKGRVSHAARSFIAYLASDKATAIISADGDYLPLSSGTLAKKGKTLK